MDIANDIKCGGTYQVCKIAVEKINILSCKVACVGDAQEGIAKTT